MTEGAKVSGHGASEAFSLKPLMFQTFVCSMAMMAFVALAGPVARVIGLAPWQMGTAVTIGGVAWMVTARLWGAASDRRGRRPILLAGLAGFAVSYFMLALFIDLALRVTMAPMIAFAGIVLGRSAIGLFYAAVPTTTGALVADHVPPNARAGAMAAIGAATAAGMVVGPGFAGLVSSWSLSLPLYATAALPAIALLVLWRVLPRVEHRAPPKGGPLKLTDRRLRRPMAVAFVAMFSVATAQIIVGFFALDRLHLSPGGAANAAGIALSVVGAVLVLAQTLLRRLRWPPARFIRIGGVIGGLGFASVVLVTNIPMLWACYTVAAFGMGWVYPSVSALAANSVEAHEQGAAAGTIAAAQGLGTTLGPLAGTAIYTLDNGMPYVLIGLMLLVTALWKTGE